MANEENIDQVMQLMEKHQETITKSQKREEQISRRSFIVSALSLVFIVVMVLIFIGAQRNSDKRLANTIKDFTYINEEFKLKDLGIQEQKEVYRKHMLRIFTVAGKAYDHNNPQSFSKDQKITFIDLCFDISDDLKKQGMNVTRWDAITVAVGESSLNPFDIGDSGLSWGAFQFKWPTAMIAYGYYKTMPTWFKNKYPIEIQKKEQLQDVYIATVLFYVYYGNMLREYRGSEQWAISMYHLGANLLPPSYYNNGDGELPPTVTIQGVKYETEAYYMDWVAMRDAFQMGNLEVGQSYARRIQARHKQKLREEVLLNNAKNTIKKLRDNSRIIKAEVVTLNKKLDHWGKKEEDAYNKFTKIYDIIQSGSFKDIRKEMNKHKPIVKEWVRKYELAKKSDKLRTKVIIIIIGILILSLLILVFIGAIKYLLLKRKLKE